MTVQSGAESLVPLLKPRSIALVGVRGGPFDPAARTSMARRFLELLLRHGYPGALYPINPRYETVGELRCYPSVASVAEPVDSALVIVPKERVAATLADCGAKGVKAVTIISSGYADAGPEGRADELAMVALAHSYGMRVLGPNCFGYFNSHDRVNLFGSASLLTRSLLRGAIGFVTQSGALAASVVDRAQERGIGFSSLITTGNQADIDNVECLEYLVEDPDTRVITLFVEGLGRTDRFRAAVRRAALLGKPCVVLKTGASEVARQVALAHTGSLVGDDAVYDAAFRQDGVIRVEEPDELFLSAALLANNCGSERVAALARVAIISMSGAMGGILADGAARHRVSLAELSPETRRTLTAIPGVTGGLNPLDAAMATWAGDFGVVGQLAAILAQDPGVDVVLLAISGLPYGERLVDDCVAAIRPTGKVFVPMWAADHADLGLAVGCLAREGVTVYETSDSALRAIRALALYRRHQAAMRAGNAFCDSSPRDEARFAKARELLRCGGRTLTEYQSKQLLSLYGVKVPPQQIAVSAADAAAIADRMGYPVVMKIHAPEIPHKTEADGLRLGLQNAAQVMDAFASVMASARAYKPDARLDGVLLAPMAPSGIEAFVGAHQDPQFGPVLVAGLGGIFVEVLGDTALRLAPLSAAEALSMLEELRGRAIFDGVRGQGPADRNAVVEVLVALSKMMTELREFISEVDINPLIVHAASHGATVADALVVLRGEVVTHGR